MDDARAREPTISEIAHDTAKDLRKVWSIDADDPGWHGLPYNVQAWMNGGAELLFIMSKAASLRPKNLNYVNTAMRNAIEERKTEPIAKPASENRNARTTGTVLEAADRLVERIRQFDAPAPADERIVRLGAGANPVRAVSQG